ncbi:hypothetical protein AJ78_03538 [Emergomyces pasteurianus Ep9510]|uniref:Helicase ATP-binding domain-containing protein n=1 Tax=Emergomyces pasteurianus Ep9510 TaxID=1447872 RepID=A0A1J9QJC2_9EURO|nr:hypothetical protein AJ78_03538 [Emergomyces pasteurianus Ep9510]
MDNQSTSTQPPESKIVRPDDIPNPTDNSFGMKEADALIGNSSSIFAPESFHVQLSDDRGAFHSQSLFCSPDPDENIWRPSNATEPAMNLALLGNQATHEQEEQNYFGSSVPSVNEQIESIPKRKRTLLSPFRMHDAALQGPSTISKPGAKGKSSQSQKGHGRNSKRKSKSAPKNWQKNRPMLANLGTSNGIEHAKSNVGKLAIPFSSTKNKDKATKEIVDTVPAENFKEAQSDRQLILGASRVLRMRPKADGYGGWLHPKITTSLYHFQRNREKSEKPPFGGFQCDEMGFGKTLQLIGQMDKLLEKDEFARHCKQKALQPILEYHARSRPSTTDDVEFLKGCSVIITTYAEVRSSIPKFEPPAGVVLESEIEKLQMRFVEENRGPLHRMKFRRIILDEAHEIKNNASHTSVAVRMLSGHFRWVVSGTPLHNGVHELYPYLDFLRIPMAGTYKEFLNELRKNNSIGGQCINDLLLSSMLKRGHDETLFGYPILKLPDVEDRDIVVNFSATERVLYQKIIAMFLEEHDVFSKPTGEPKKEYQNRLTMILRLRMFTSHPLLAQMVLKDFLTVGEVQSIRLSIGKRSEPRDAQMCSLLEDLIRYQTLRGNEQETSSWTSEARSPKFQISRSQKLINDFVDALKSPSEGRDKEKCIKCHCLPTSVYLTSCLHIYCQGCARETMIQTGSVCDCGAPVGQTVSWHSLQSLIASATPHLEEGNAIALANLHKRSRRKAHKNGSNSEAGGQNETFMNWVEYAGHLMPGSKLTAISSHLEEWFKNCTQSKVVIFTQFLDMASILGSMCKNRGWGCLLYTSKMRIRLRETNVVAFSTDPAIRVLVCSLRTAATGLDLSAANKCILVDLWWNEAIEQQAFFRLFRINQTRNVEFVRILIKNSIDDRLQLIQNDKTERIDKVMGSEVLSSWDSLAKFYTVLGVEEDDSTETGYTFISDEEAERRHDTRFDSEASGQAQS